MMGCKLENVYQEDIRFVDYSMIEISENKLDTDGPHIVIICLMVIYVGYRCISIVCLCKIDKTLQFNVKKYY